MLLDVQNTFPDDPLILSFVTRLYEDTISVEALEAMLYHRKLFEVQKANDASNIVRDIIRDVLLKQLT